MEVKESKHSFFRTHPFLRYNDFPTLIYILVDTLGLDPFDDTPLFAKLQGFGLYQAMCDYSLSSNIP